MTAKPGGVSVQAPAPPAQPAPSVADSEKTVEAAVKDSLENPLPLREQEAKADAVLAGLEQNHTPDEIRELVRRVTGRRAGTAGQALAVLRADLTSVSRQLESQKV